MYNSDLKIYQKTFNLIFNKIKNVFPFLSKKDFLDFKNKYLLFYNKLDRFRSDEDFFIHLEKFFNSLKNSHTKLVNYPGKVFFKPKGYSVIKCEDKFLLKKEAIVGEILLIDGQSPHKILNKYKRRVAASTIQYKEQQALKFLLVSKDKSYVKIRLKADGKKRDLNLKRSLIKFVSWKEIIKAKILKDGIGYLKIITWIDREQNKKLIDEKLKYFSDKKIKSLIIDVRDNAGGNSDMAKYLASHFFDKKVLFSITKIRKNKKSFLLKTQYAYVEPNKTHFSLPIILLINSNCLSSNEYFIAGLKDNKRAFLIGEKTGGGSGNPKFFEIPFKDSSLRISISTWQYFRANKKRLEGCGVWPHLVVKETCEDLEKGDDGVLKIAIKKCDDLLED